MSAKIILIDKSNIKNTNIFNENYIIIPLDLETQIYLIEKKINFLNPLEIIDNNFHKKIIKETDSIIKSIKFKNNDFPSINEDILSNIRFDIYLIYYLKFILDYLLIKFKTYTIILQNDKFVFPNYLLKFLICFKDYSPKILFLGSLKYISTDLNFFSFNFSAKINYNKKSILLNNLGYNFKRLLFYFMSNGFQIMHIDNQKNYFINLLNKFHILKVIKLKKNITKNNNINELQIDFEKINEKFLKIFFLNSYDILNNKLINDYNYSISFENFLCNFSNLKFMISNINKGKNGIFSKLSKKTNSKSIIISHGTLASSFNQYDKIYKKIIANQVYSKDFDYAFSQSKISDSFFNEYNSKNNIISGNILFSFKNKYQKLIKKNEFRVLYAVTQKTINSMQLFGCEMYYEFLDNLEFLNNIAYNKSIKIFVKLHPSAMNNESSLSKIYTNLTFVNHKINSILKKIDITCSFSSSVIEDSLNMKIPVILLDRWKRYRHTKSQNFPYEDDYPIMYANDKKQFFSALDFIKNIKNFDFEKCIYTSHYLENIKKSISKFI